MHTLAKASLGLLAAALVMAAPAGPVASESLPATAPMSFGMDAASVAAQSAAGAKPDYGTLWIGPWTLSSGWGGPDAQLDRMREAGVTPAIHFYYWGDDISQSCLEHGCYSSLHKAQKDKAGWSRLADQLVQHLDARMQGRPAVVFLESEFNKGDVATYEPLDGYLAEKAARIQRGYPAAKVVMSLGNWNPAAWGTWDRTAAASDYVGIQGMRGSTRQSAADYATLYEGVLSGARTLQAKFGKPVFLQDIALSTYPEPDYLRRQAEELGQFFAGMGELRAAGVQAVVYRSWKDSPAMDTANWYGEAERHWGLAWASNGTAKAGGQVWVEGVKAARAGSAPAASGASSTTAAPAPYQASFTTGPGANQYWVEVKVSASPAPAKVEAKADGGAWKALRQRSPDAWGESIAVAKGTPVQFRATAPDGRTATSAPAPWLGSAAATTSTTAPATATSAPAPFKASFSPRSVGNDWWVEAAVSSSQGVAKVEAKVGSGGAWTELPRTGWGTYAKSAHAPDGTYVQFRATSAGGATATSATYVWGY